MSTTKIGVAGWIYPNRQATQLGLFPGLTFRDYDLNGMSRLLLNCGVESLTEANKQDLSRSLFYASLAFNDPLALAVFIDENGQTCGVWGIRAYNGIGLPYLLLSRRHTLAPVWMKAIEDLTSNLKTYRDQVSHYGVHIPKGDRIGERLAKEVGFKEESKEWWTCVTP